MSNNQQSTSTDIALSDDLEQKDTVTVKGGLLRAALKIAGLRDVRYYLNYVRISRGEFGTVLTVTDGHRIGLAMLDHTPAKEGNYSFPRTPLGTALINKHETYQIVFKDSLNAYIHTEYCDIRSSSEEMNYPDWRNVVPSQINLANSRRNVQYNTKYLTDAREFIGAYFDKSPKYMNNVVVINSADNRGAGVMIHSDDLSSGSGSDVFVVIMPVMFEGADKGLWTAPAFAQKRKTIESSKSGK